MTSFLIAIAMCYVLIKIPFWILGSIRGSKGRSVIGSMVRGFLAYKTFGLARAGATAAASSFKARRVPHATGTGWTDPYRNVEATPEGQTMLPLAGLHRTWPSARSQQSTGGTPSGSGPRRGRSRRRSSTGSTGSTGSSTDAEQEDRQGVLFTRTGKPKPGAQPGQVSPGSYRWRPNPGEQRMLPIVARHVPDRTARESLGDERSGPRELPDRPPESQQPALFTPDGRIRAYARPPASAPGAVPLVTEPGKQQYLNMPLRLPRPQTSPQPKNTTGTQHSEPSRADPVQPAPNPRPGRRQMSLLRPDGTVTSRARARPTRAAKQQAQQHARHVRAHARQQRHRRAQSSPAAPEFRAPTWPEPPRRGASRAGRVTASPENTPPPEATARAPRQQRSPRLRRPQDRLGQPRRDNRRNKGDRDE